MMQWTLVSFFARLVHFKKELAETRNKSLMTYAVLKNGTLRLESSAILVCYSCGLPALPAGILNVEYCPHIFVRRSFYLSYDSRSHCPPVEYPV